MLLAGVIATLGLISYPCKKRTMMLNPLGDLNS